MNKLTFITTHPIQYNAPFFKLLTERGKVELKVFYTWPQAIEGFEDVDFGKQIKWDIPLLEGYDWEGIDNISKKPSPKYWSGIDCPTLIQKIKAFHPDAILVYGWNLKSHFKTMRYFKGKIPVWFFGDSTLLDEQPGIKKILRRMWLSFVYRHIDKAFYVGSNNKDYFKAHGVKEEQLVFFPHAIDNTRFSDNEGGQYENKALQWREELGYKDDDIVILFAGKLEPKKNPLILIEAIKQIYQSSDLPIRLLFIGNGPLESELREKSKDLHYVKFLPFQNQSDMPKVYRLGDVFCLPSKGPGETWGLATNEALACGRPVLLSDKVGCAIDLVKNGVNGLVFDHMNFNDLVEKILSIVSSFEKLDRTAISNSVSEWSFESRCKAIEETFNIYMHPE